jgi:hypothetical protein
MHLAVLALPVLTRSLSTSTRKQPTNSARSYTSSSRGSTRTQCRMWAGGSGPQRTRGSACRLAGVLGSAFPGYGKPHPRDAVRVRPELFVGVALRVGVDKTAHMCRYGRVSGRFERFHIRCRLGRSPSSLEESTVRQT